MSIPVPLDRLADAITHRGASALLITVDGDGRPRVAGVAPTAVGAVLHVGAGRRSCANAAARPLVTLVWPALPAAVDGHEHLASHHLVVDATVTSVSDGTAVLAPSHAVLHRVPDQAGATAG